MVIVSAAPQPEEDAYASIASPSPVSEKSVKV